MSVGNQPGGPWDELDISTRSGELMLLVLSQGLQVVRNIEAKAVREVNAKVVASFIYDQICCRFGVPLVLISDRGQGFQSELVEALVDKMGIQHRFSSPYHPQCNGLVENTNGKHAHKVCI